MAVLSSRDSRGAKRIVGTPDTPRAVAPGRMVRFGPLPEKGCWFCHLRYVSLYDSLTFRVLGSTSGQGQAQLGRIFRSSAVHQVQDPKHGQTNP